MSIAFNKGHPILDANVKRVLGRYKKISFKTENEKQKKLWLISEKLTPNKESFEYTQGIMDLGSMICTPIDPACKNCPIQNKCKSFQLNLQNMIPSKNLLKVQKKEKNINWLLIASKDKVLLKRNVNKGIWQNLWLFPEANSLNYEKFNLLEEKESLPLIVHNLSHQKLSIFTKKYFLENKDRLPIDRRGFVWVNKKESVKMGIPKPVKTILENHL